MKEVGTFAGHGRDVMTAAWHPVHEDLFASGAANGSLLYWLVGRQSSQVADSPGLSCHHNSLSRDCHGYMALLTYITVIPLDAT